MQSKLPPKEYYESLEKVPTSGGAIIRNSKGEFLIVKNTYREHYGIAGGMTNKDETPQDAVVREVKEELGIDITVHRLFCIDYDIREPFTRILFIFDCGIISDEEISKIKTDEDEIEIFTFLNFEEAIKKLGPKVQKRISNSINALKNNSFVYLENGEIANKEKEKMNYAFIDSQNVNLAIRELGWKLNFKRFRKYLKDKYKVEKAYIFIGYLENNKELYSNLEKSGFICIFKPTLEYKDGKTKGNCDSELVLQTIVESNNYDKAIIITGDGDFNCLAKYLVNENKLEAIMIPNRLKFSALLKFTEFKPFLRYMNDLKQKLEYK